MTPAPRAPRAARLDALAAGGGVAHVARLAALAAGGLAALAAGCGVPPGAAARGERRELAPREFAPPPGVALEQTCVTTGPELCFDAVDNNCNGLLEEGCGVKAGVLQMVAAWAEAEADVDLLVTDPNGELVRPGSGNSAGLTKEKDCPGSDRQCHGQNLENVYLEPDAEPQRGHYRVALRLEKSNGAPLPIKVRFAARVGPRVYGLAVELGAQGEEKVLSFRL
jgi:tRNA (guanosine-2'-O-)-methyltransferase